MSVRLHVHVLTNPGQADLQIAAFERLAPVVRAEDGCLQYELFRVADEADQFVVIEHWASEDALAAHLQAAHVLKAREANLTFRAAPAKVMRLVGTPIV